MSIADKIRRAKSDLEAVKNAGYEAGVKSAPKPVVQSLNVTANGTYTAPNGVDGYSPVTVNVPDVNGSYDEGYSDGFEAGKAEGGNAEEAYNAGKQDMNVTMMDAITCNGTRTNYNSAFWGEKWTDELFKPHVVIKPTNFNSGFYGSKIENSAYTDLLDFSNCTTLSAAFYMSSVKKLKVIDARNTTGVGMGNIFAMCSKLESIDEFYPSSVSSNKPSFSSTFVGCSALTKIIFKSEISQNGLNLQSSPKLSLESIESIINNLSDTTSGLSITLSRTAVDAACKAMEGEGWDSTNSIWFPAITSGKSNWTISLM